VDVIVDANGQLGTVTSSERFKEQIKPMDRASEAILALQPVTFRYKQKLDPNSIPQFGLVAEEAEKVDPDLVARDQEGKPYTVRYEAVNAMLLNEFLKEHRKLETLEATVAAQQKGFESQIAALTAALKAQAAQIQKVSDQLKTQGVASGLVENRQVTPGAGCYSLLWIVTVAVLGEPIM
jgi:predicted ribosome quality control (RQC) complex YloA/Tae2 family protein